MTKFDRKIINDFAYATDFERAEVALAQAENILAKALEKLSFSNAFVSNKLDLVAINSFNSGAILPTSYMDLVLIVESPQIKLNTEELMKTSWKKFWNRVKFAWKNRNKRKKRKKKKKKIEESSEVVFSKPKKYDINYFCLDMVSAISEFITEKDVVKLNAGTLIIEGENLPYTIRIYPVFKTEEENVYKKYLPYKNELVELNLKEYNEILQNVQIKCGEDRFNELTRIFAGIFDDVMEKRPNTIFIESLVANLPEKAFLYDEPYTNFVFAVNYLNNIPTNSLFSIANPAKKIFQDDLCATTLGEVNTFFKKMAVKL